MAASLLSDGYAMWANRAELDLVRLTGATFPVFGSRGRPVETFWKPLFSKHSHVRDHKVRGLKWLDAQFKALKSELMGEATRPFDICRLLAAPPPRASAAREACPRVFSEAASLADKLSDCVSDESFPPLRFARGQVVGLFFSPGRLAG